MDAELTFGQWLRRSRKARDLTQPELAKQISCALGTIRKLEADELRPSKELAARLARYFGVPEHDHARFVAYARGQADTPLQPLRADPTSTAAATRLASHRHNLPVQLTPFIGRERDVALVRDQLLRPHVRLLTLTGPGGIGKTRFALQVAAELLDAFRDGIYFVALASLSDATLVPATIAQTLGLRESGSLPPRTLLHDYLRDKQLLLLLDNLEQIPEAGVGVVDLLTMAPGLKVLMTSRVALHLYGEHEYVVPALALPDLKHLPPVERLTEYEAVRLFIERSEAVKADFAATHANAPAIAEICARLDGLPLAIELAAARSKYFAPQALLVRLEHRLDVLSGGGQSSIAAPDAAQHHRLERAAPCTRGADAVSTDRRVRGGLHAPSGRGGV